MIRFTRLVEEVANATEPYRDKMYGFEPDEWLANGFNLALTDGGGNIALFELSADGIYTGHYFFVVRGKAAKKLAIEMLTYFFDTTDAKVLRGLTPLTNLGARWMSRQIGFKGLGIIQTDNGPCELFILMKEV